MKGKAYVINEGPKWLIVIIWFIINFILFITTYFYYQNNEKYFYTRAVVGSSLPWARSSAMLLNFNSMLVLLPVCRNLISFIRGSNYCCKKIMRRQLDHNITFHKLIAYMIFIQTAIHVYAHCYNFENFLHAHNANSSILANILTNYHYEDESENVNPITSGGTSPAAVKNMFQTISGCSGVLMTISLVLICSSATEVIRRSYFEVFWYVHHLFIVFYLGMFVHGIQGIVRGQVNLEENRPNECSKEPETWPNPQCKIPKFSGAEAASWKWIIVPVLIYLIEHIIRIYRSREAVTITKIVKHPSQVLEIQMKKPGFIMNVGQYIFIQCKRASYLEWHPFTLTSAPEDNYFSVHIRVVGDWTNALAHACGMNNEDEEMENLPSIAVDGPFGTASEDVFRYQVVVLIAAGIGVTPFASVLKSIWYKYASDDPQLKLSKVYFYWICPNTQSFEWFSDLLISLENQMIEKEQGHFIDFNIFLTRGWNKNQANNLVIFDSDVTDPITGLQHKTQFGRPKWDDVFGKISESHLGVNIGVFYCGPSKLSKELAKQCNNYSRSEPLSAQFHFNKENF